MHDYYSQTWYIGVPSQVAERLKTQNFRKSGDTRKVSKRDRMIL